MRPGPTYLSCRCRSMRASRSGEKPEEVTRLIWFMAGSGDLPPFVLAFRRVASVTMRSRRRHMDTNGDTVSTETRGRTLVVTIERPQARNAVDGPTARLLYDAFKA